MSAPESPVAGAHLSTEGRRLLEYLASRAAELSAVALRERVRAAMRELDTALVGVTEAEARLQPIPGDWALAQIVDHVAQTQMRAAEELRYLLAASRPPGPPVYDALTSGGASWASWTELLEGLRSANAVLDGVLETGTEEPSATAVTAHTILVVNRASADGPPVPEVFVAELTWKEYVLVQRLHLLDHRTQARKLRAMLDGVPR
jgi:hypothetical protein